MTRDTENDWAAICKSHQDRLQRPLGSVERLRLLHDAPMFSFWADIKRELLLAAEEITHLRRRLEEKNNDGG